MTFKNFRLKQFKLKQLVACGLLVTAPLAQAHRAWMLPSATVFSGETAWLTVDAAVSNSLFYFEHHPLDLKMLDIISPTGKPVEAQNQAKAKYRSTFDVKLVEEGTYTLQMTNQGAQARYKLDGENKRWRGAVDKLSEIPKAATDVTISQSDRRMQVFVTKGTPSSDSFTSQGWGIELIPVTHPNDLFAGEAAEFKFLLDGQPAVGLDVVIIPGGIRYRDQVNEIKATTDSSGHISVVWPAAGMYWLEAELVQDSVEIKGAKRRLAYSSTLEVLPL